MHILSGVSADLKRHCPVCGTDESVPYLEKGMLRLVRCTACSMVYVNPVPEEFASGRYYTNAGPDYYLSPAKVESDYAGVRFEREIRLLRRFCPAGAVLDVGCSSGAFLFQLKERYDGAYDILGTDVSGAPLDYAEGRGIPVLRGDFLKQDYGDRRFDAVTFWAVLEHLVDPGSFLERAWQLLKARGLCFILVPNFESLAFRMLGAKYRYVYPQHLNYFTRRTLGRVVEQRFRIVNVRSMHFNPIVLWQDWRSGGSEVSNTARAELLKRTTRYKQNPWLKPLKALYSASEKMLGAVGLADNLAVVGMKEGERMKDERVSR